MIPYLDQITKFVKVCAEYPQKSDELHKNLIGIIGDLAKFYGHSLKAFIADKSITTTIQEAASEEDMKDLVGYTQRVSSILSQHIM